MVIRDILIWWYTTGWRQRLKAAEARLDGIVDYFSIGLLLKTLFAPFRQISAGQVDGPLDAQMRAFFDRLFSRSIGAVVRLIVMCIGLVTLACSAVVAMFILVVWAVLPVLPFVGLGLFIMGWVPWSL